MADTDFTYGVSKIAVARNRQVHVHGYDDPHDDEHKTGELIRAGVAYAQVGLAQVIGASFEITSRLWPFEDETFRPDADPIQNLAKAGAFIAAEIDRLKRARDQANIAKLSDPDR